jgi:hypothetical protein
LRGECRVSGSIRAHTVKVLESRLTSNAFLQSPAGAGQYLAEYTRLMYAKIIKGLGVA